MIKVPAATPIKIFLKIPPTVAEIKNIAKAARINPRATLSLNTGNLETTEVIVPNNTGEIKTALPTVINSFDFKKSANLLT